MLTFPRFLFVAFSLSLVACGPPEEQGETVSVDPSEVGYGTEDDPAVENTLALEPGLYVIDGSDCADPANAGLRVWTGQGLEGSATRGCRFEVSSREGEVYTGTQSCTNTGDDSNTTTELSIEVLEPGSIVLTEADGPTHLTLCPEGQMPEWAREKLSVE